ncbi:hypothetical protein EIP91_000733 [Steccherinum ochraceum]|uniref:Uncharacterized protein n=1 Tax=Steccherinum ochraceum TaxID=92696 RepID=A0A4R0RLT1_9APHY|nr:hypothetical protein EIP91_000733 [Steccherinum ochraceum]
MEMTSQERIAMESKRSGVYIICKFQTARFSFSLLGPQRIARAGLLVRQHKKPRAPNEHRVAFRLDGIDARLMPGMTVQEWFNHARESYPHLMSKPLDCISFSAVKADSESSDEDIVGRHISPASWSEDLSLLSSDEIVKITISHPSITLLDPEGDPAEVTFAAADNSPYPEDICASKDNSADEDISADWLPIKAPALDTEEVSLLHTLLGHSVDDDDALAAFFVSMMTDDLGNIYSAVPLLPPTPSHPRRRTNSVDSTSCCELGPYTHRMKSVRGAAKRNVTL